MRLYFTKLPVYYPESHYESVIAKVADNLSREEGLVSLFKFGSIADPGISDIDLLAVFEDEYVCKNNPLAILSGEEKYLFTHSVFGISRSFFNKLPEYGTIPKLELIIGEELQKEKLMGPDNRSIVKKQEALEYLLVNLAARTTEYNYKVMQLRNIFLSIKALKLDLMQIESENSELLKDIDDLIEIRTMWFNKKETEEVSEWYDSFYYNFLNYCSNVFSEKQLVLPERKHYHIAKNQEIIYSDAFKIDKRGFALPTFVSRLNSNFKRINKRLLKLQFQFPFLTDRENEFHASRFKFYAAMTNYNYTHLKYFSPLANQVLIKMN